VQDRLARIKLCHRWWRRHERRTRAVATVGCVVAKKATGPLATGGESARHDRAQAPHAGDDARAKAMDYTLKRWDALARYVEDGRYPIDNNPVENAIRPIALGRKNWLFVGAERAGRRAADIMGLLATAKANGLDPHAWLTDVLTRLPITLDRDISTLLPLPGHWVAAPAG